MYAKINSNNTIQTYPYSLAQLRAANPRTAFSAQPTADELAPFGVVPVLPVERPEPLNPLTQVVEEGAPVYSAGQWSQHWITRAPTQIEAAQIKSGLIQAFSAAAQTRLDEWARTRNYDGILSLCTYATSTVPQFASEGQRGVDLRDATWAALYAILAQVEAGTRPLPASFAAIEGELPALTWGGE